MDLELTDEQADKLNRALAGEEVELDDAEAALLSQVIAPPSAQPVAPSKSMGESALQGYAQGASFGLSDELGGVVHEGVKRDAQNAVGWLKTGPGRAVLRRLIPGLKDMPDAAVDAVLDQGMDEAGELVLGAVPRERGGTGLPGAGYAAGRDQMRSEVKKAQESNPKTFFAGNVAGAMSVPMPGGGAAKPFQTVIGRSLENAGKFGAQGALQGFGASDADLLKGEFGQAAEDTAIGGGIGAGMGFATGPAAYGWARHARPALQSLANSRAVAAIAPSASLANKLRKVASTEPEIQQLGSDILDSRILRPLGTAAGTKARNDALMAFEGANIGTTMDRADDVVSQGVTAGPSRDLQREAVVRALRGAADTSATRAILPGVEEKLLESTGSDFAQAPGVLSSNAEPPATFRELWKNKSQLQSALKPDDFSNLGQKLYRRGVGGYTRGVYNQVERALGPDEITRLRESARRYGTAASIDDVLTDQVTRNAVNQPISLGDAARGAAFDAIPGGSTAATLISSLLRGRTDSTLATGARALSRVRQPPVPAGLVRATATPDRLSQAYKAMLEKFGLEESEASP